jgi:hypothetical protein
MNAQDLNETTIEVASEKPVNRVTPWNKVWEGITETSRVIYPAWDILKGRTIPELAVIIAQFGLVVLDYRAISTGSGVTTTNGLIFALVLAVMIWSPALYLLYYLKAGRRNHDKSPQETIESRTDRGSE